jgi:hypothetical protein
MPSYFLTFDELCFLITFRQGSREVKFWGPCIPKGRKNVEVWDVRFLMGVLGEGLSFELIVWSSGQLI